MGALAVHYEHADDGRIEGEGLTRVWEKSASVRATSISCAGRASRVMDTQRDAEAFGRGVARREKVEFILAGRDGEIRERDSYGNDPRNVPG